MTEEILHTKGFVEKADTKLGVIEDAVITSEVIDREGESITSAGLEFKNFLKNPLLLWSHNAGMGENRPPIGKVTKIWKSETKADNNNVETHFSAEFDMKDEFAAGIARKFKEGFLNAFSIGFRALERDDTTISGGEVLEFSAVNIPANPEALLVLRGKGFDVNESFDDYMAKTAISTRVHGSDPRLAAIDTSWDGPAAVRRAEGREELRRMHAWVEAGADQDAKQSYKLPHTRPDGTIIFRGVTAAMGALLGARGGVRIPDADRRGVYNHLAADYRRFDREAPEFRFFEDMQGHFDEINSDSATEEETARELPKVETRKETKRHDPRRLARVIQTTSDALCKTLKEIEKNNE